MFNLRLEDEKKIVSIYICNIAVGRSENLGANGNAGLLKEKVLLLFQPKSGGEWAINPTRTTIFDGSAY